MPTTYEWDIETWADDEVVDHDHRDRLHEFGGEELTRAVAEDGYRLVLVRNDSEGRSWAYVTNGELAPVFLDSYEKPVAEVPARFVSEFNL
ncbi:MAG: hypothetical protein Q7T86_19400 [Hyphomicrobiaceae bacterium]|nr:hypothetical protein [Hyphomicrobiaceae bacterium]